VYIESDYSKDALQGLKMPL